MKKLITAFVLALLSLTFLSCSKISFFNKDKTTAHKKAIPEEPELLSIFKEAYPDLTFGSLYNSEKEDWKITILVPENDNYRMKDFYWCNGKLLPEDEVQNQENYIPLLYNYNYGKPLQDPSDYTQEQIELIKKYTSSENRKTGAGTPMFFFDFLYESSTQGKLETHIKKITFLKGTMNVHERIYEPLKTVAEQIKEAAKTDKETAAFLKEIKKNEAYYWRIIAGTDRKSFHSLGIAIDITPKSYHKKEVFWSWAKDKNPDKWMLTSLKWRWMPPEKVIQIFEDNGFIWGGKWIIWDNMHFEYRPDLITYAKYCQSQQKEEVEKNH